MFAIIFCWFWVLLCCRSGFCLGGFVRFAVVGVEFEWWFWMMDVGWVGIGIS